MAFNFNPTPGNNFSSSNQGGGFNTGNTFSNTNTFNTQGGGGTSFSNSPSTFSSGNTNTFFSSGMGSGYPSSNTFSNTGGSTFSNTGGNTGNTFNAGGGGGGNMFSTGSTLGGGMMGNTGGGMMGNFGNISPEKINPNNDLMVNDPPKDGISSLAWMPNGPFFTAGSWDKTISCYEVQLNGAAVNTKLAARKDLDGSVLCNTWSADGRKVFYGGTSNKAMLWDLAENKVAQVAQHDAPIKEVKWLNELNSGTLLTASWDKTIRYWDLRQPTPIASITLAAPVHALDCSYPVLVVSSGEKSVSLYNLQSNPTSPFRNIDHPLKKQIRCVSIFPDGSGFALGSIEGRVAIQFIQDDNPSHKKSFAFKCHRPTNNQNVVYAVNCISFHPVYGTFSTAGADGCFHFWDKDSKQRLKQFQPCCTSISATAFSREPSLGNHQLFSYAVSYDWSKGAANSQLPENKINAIYLQRPQDDAVKPKPKQLR